MSVIIDGYNLLSAVGITGRGLGPGGLERSRLALLNFLAASLRPDQLARTTVVFDAREAPPGLPRVVAHRGITVRFAAGFEDADSLIEELIRADSAPRRLTVVSSDHRLQRAARRRKARAVDSDLWYAEIVRQRRRSMPTPSARPAVPLLEEDVSYWVRQFGGQSLLADLFDEGSSGELSGGQTAGHERPREDDGPQEDDSPEIDNPFPPGYAEDLLADDRADVPYDPFPPGYGEDLQEE